MGRSGAIAFALLLGGCACELTSSVPDAEIGLPDVRDPAAFPLALYDVVPGHGPFAGGNVVTLRGTGFAESFGEGCAPCGVVRFGGADATVRAVVDDRRLEVIVPPSAPGVVDVEVAAASIARLPDGYAYDALTITPAYGSTGGGTYVVVTSAVDRFTADTTITFGGAPCRDVVVTSPAQLSCRTPPGEVGEVDVEVSGAGSVRVERAFRYENPALPVWGLGGGPLDGNLDVVVFGSDGPLEGAVVIAGAAPEWRWRGVTDARGRVTLGGPDLHGPVDLHVAGHCHDPSSFVGFDAARATIVLAHRWGDVACTSLPPTGSSPAPTTVRGRLERVWEAVPAPAPGRARVAYVSSTSDYEHSTPPVAEVREHDTSFELAVPTYSAVYAVAGVEDDAGFHPAVMGVSRGVLLEPGEVREGLVITMDIPLDQELAVSLVGTPEIARDDMTAFHASAHLRIEEGFFVRTFAAGAELDARSSPTPTFTFDGQPARTGALAGAWYQVSASRAGGFDAPPRSSRVLHRVTETDRTIVIDGFLDVPTLTLPLEGERIGGLLRWTAPPEAETTRVAMSSGSLSWNVWASAATSEALLPPYELLGVTPPLAEDVLLLAVSWRGAGGEPGAVVQYAAEGSATHTSWSAYRTARW